jgi:hypothetical protein
MGLSITEALAAVERAKNAVELLAATATHGIKTGKLDPNDPIIGHITAQNTQLVELQIRAKELQAAKDVIAGPSYSFSASDVYKTANQIQSQCFALGKIVETKTGLLNPVVPPPKDPPGFFSGVGSVLEGAGNLALVVFGGVAVYLLYKMATK